MPKSKEKNKTPEDLPVEDPHWPRSVASRLNRLNHAQFEVKVVLGRTEMTFEELEKLGKDSIVETERFSGQPADILVNGTLFGCGEIVVVGDHCALRITDLKKPETI